MKKRQLWIASAGMFLVVFLMSACIVFADNKAWTYGIPEISGGYGSDFTGNEAIVTVTGTVKKIENMYKDKNSLQLIINADEGGKWVVYMGPKWFVEHQMIKFAVGDKVEVRGKKVGGAIIASEASKGNMTMKLRNEEDGQAVWQCCFPRTEHKN